MGFLLIGKQKTYLPRAWLSKAQAYVLQGVCLDGSYFYSHRFSMNGYSEDTQEDM